MILDEGQRTNVEGLWKFLIVSTAMCIRHSTISDTREVYKEPVLFTKLEGDLVPMSIFRIMFYLTLCHTTLLLYYLIHLIV